MSYLVKVLFLLTLITGLLLSGEYRLLVEYVGLLLIIASYVVRTKYTGHSALVVFEFLIIVFLAGYSLIYLLLMGIITHDLFLKKLYPGVTLPIATGIYYLSGLSLAAYLFLLAICAYTGYLNRQMKDTQKTFLEAFDRERINRYMLEETKNKLLASAREVAYLAEIRERNRIAREIHDNVGHVLAGNLLHLQAASKLIDKDPDRTRAIIGQSIENLAGSVELLRSTVHNIRPQDHPGWPYFEKIIENFNYCQVNFTHRGDISQVTPVQTEILASIIREAMTNTARHSNADLMNIEMEIRDRIIRLYIKDNGSGCDKLKEGMGISGMRERVSNSGGSLTVNAENGFMIVCVLTRDEETRGDQSDHEGVNSR